MSTRENATHDLWMLHSNGPRIHHNIYFIFCVINVPKIVLYYIYTFKVIIICILDLKCNFSRLSLAVVDGYFRQEVHGHLGND